MSEVQRYGMQWHEVTERSVFMADEDGDYVKFSDYEKLQQQVNQLAGENSYFNELADRVRSMDDHSFFGSTSKAQQVMGEFCNAKTPHTDAFLLNAQADGVDKLGMHYNFSSPMLLQVTARDFSKKLRAQATALQQKDEGHA